MIAGISQTAVLLLGLVLVALMIVCGGTQQGTPVPTPDVEAAVQFEFTEERKSEATEEAKA